MGHRRRHRCRRRRLRHGLFDRRRGRRRPVRDRPRWRPCASMSVPDFREPPRDLAGAAPANAAADNEYIVAVTATGGTGGRELSATQTRSPSPLRTRDEPPGAPAAPRVVGNDAGTDRPRGLRRPRCPGEHGAPPSTTTTCGSAKKGIGGFRPLTVRFTEAPLLCHGTAPRLGLRGTDARGQRGRARRVVADGRGKDGRQRHTDVRRQHRG